MIVARCLNCSWVKREFDAAMRSNSLTSSTFIWAASQTHAKEFDHDIQIGREQ